MNEYQNDYDPDYGFDNSISQQYQISEIAAGHEPNHISFEVSYSDYTNQPDYEFDNQLSSNFSNNSNLSFEPDSISYSPDTTSFLEQNNQLLEQHSLQNLNHQEMYDATINVEKIYGYDSTSELSNGGGTTFDRVDDSIAGYEETNSMEALSHNNAFDSRSIEQPLEHSSSSFDTDLNYNQQRTGREPTADELNRANYLTREAQREHDYFISYQNDAKHYEEYNKPELAQSSHEKAAAHKQKEEELRAKADSLRHPY